MKKKMTWANFVGFDCGWSGDALWWETWKMWAQFDEKVKRTRSGGNRNGIKSALKTAR
jgi:hypothetical protein